MAADVLSTALTIISMSVLVTEGSRNTLPNATNDDDDVTNDDDGADTAERFIRSSQP